ncbi:plasmodesmata-located protein 5-like [Triticum aestivum]|uniref:plasmodesmata-located protein 5-like n=1 Tax=Triticum aestivum TaxID=4565 RepID=UPI001D00419E|nr:plasmodesmata-located protein 5-like [Triticum aestivum]
MPLESPTHTHMALSRRLPLLLLLSLVAAMTAVTGTAPEVIVTKCYPPPTPTVNGSGGLLPLLDALPSAAARTGFASLGAGGALARGFCFGDPAPDPCLRCLSDAGRKTTGQCGDASRRAGFLNDGCFLGYADTNASSSARADDDIGAVTFSGDAVPRLDDADVQKLVTVAQSLVPRSANGQLPAVNATATASNGDTVRVLAQCATDRAATECARCLRDSALQMARSWGAAAGAVQGSVAAVLGSNCYLRFEISAPPLPLGEQTRRMIKENVALTVCIAIIFLLVVAVMALAACVVGMRMGIQAWNAAVAAAAAAQGN